MDRRIVGARQRIDNLLVRTRQQPINSDDELKAELARYLCILCSGLLEESLRLLLSAYASNKSSPRISNYVSARLSDFQNPNYEKILVLLASFEPSWRDHFEAMPSSEIKDAINSVVLNRHQIAHGKPVGISVNTFAKYYEQVGIFIDSLDALLSV